MVNDLEYKKELLDWFKQIYPSLINPFAITLTNPNTQYSHQSQIKHFMNLLNSSYLKSRYRRYGDKLDVICIKEGCKHKKTHFHLILSNPYLKRDKEFIRLINECWNKVGGGKYNDVKKMYSFGYMEYISKLSSKSDIKDSIVYMDLNNNGVAGEEVILSDF